MIPTSSPASKVEAGLVPDDYIRSDRSAAVRTVALLDTAAGSTNLGDHIIMESVREQLAEVFREYMVFGIASHEWMGARSRGLIRNARWTVSGGTSLLSSRMWFRASWKLGPRDALGGLNVILMGAGWHQYQYKADPYSRWILRSVLSSTGLHSVRDDYTRGMLAAIGVDNVVNTACPTMWTLTPSHCAGIPRHKADVVVTTINSYAGLQNRAADQRMLETLKRKYRTVYVWIQTHTDYEYARALVDGLEYINPSVSALDGVLTGPFTLDYVGNRLHAGIRALQRGRRAVIVAIDNRAREMGRDFGLPTVDRTDFERLETMVDGPLMTEVRLPADAIAQWKNQFRDQT